MADDDDDGLEGFASATEYRFANATGLRILPKVEHVDVANGRKVPKLLRAFLNQQYRKHQRRLAEQNGSVSDDHVTVLMSDNPDDVDTVGKD